MNKQFDELSNFSAEGVSRRVATRLHITRERVRQIELRALNKLRHLAPTELIWH